MYIRIKRLKCLFITSSYLQKMFLSGTIYADNIIGPKAIKKSFYASLRNLNTLTKCRKLKYPAMRDRACWGKQYFQSVSAQYEARYPQWVLASYGRFSPKSKSQVGNYLRLRSSRDPDQPKRLARKTEDDGSSCLNNNNNIITLRQPVLVDSEVRSKALINNI